MELAYTDEQQFLREAVRGAVEREAPLARVRAWVLEDADDGSWRLFEQQGWTGIGVAEDAGGQGGELMELAILAEELGRGAVPADALYATLLAARLLAAAGEDVSALATGETRAAVVAPGDRPLDVVAGAATAPAAAGGTAPADDDGPAAALVLGAPGAALFVTPGGAVHETADVTPRRMVDRTRALGDVALSGEPARSVDLPDGALTELSATAAVVVAADALGAAQRMLDETVAYVKDRVQFGVPVGSFQAVKHAASEMLVAIEGARSAVQYAAWSAAPLDAWVAKAHASRAAVLAADKALFLHGAVGYTWEHDLQLLIKRAKSDAQLYGGPGTYDDRVADALDLVG